MMIKSRISQQLTAVAFCVLVVAAPARAYQLAQRWTLTASGPTGTLGSPATLTWSLAPDGTSIDQLGSSNLVAFLDDNFGIGPGGDDYTVRPWFNFFKRSFDRWSQLGGVTYIYEPNDDGVAHGPVPGALGIRGDIRLAGAAIPGSVVAYNDRPNDGDMVIDTGEIMFFTAPEGDYLNLRNTVMHEHGHGLGLLHLDSDDSQFLMEPVVTQAFEGPQFDDIRGLHRAYGDVFEKANFGAGNDSAANATPLGPLQLDETISVGADAESGTRIEVDQFDFLSIDDSFDTDFFSFDAPGASTIDIVVTPLGPDYLEAPRFGTQTLIESSALSNLTLALFDMDGTTFLELENSGGLGDPESILSFDLPAAGRYYARVTGNADDVQMYRLDLTATAIPEPDTVPLVVLVLLACGALFRRACG